MRKLFVLVLALAIVPLMVGCRLLGDYGTESNPVAATTTAATSIKPVVVLPAATVNGSIRAAVNLTGATVTFTGATGTVYTFTASGLTYTADKSIALTEFASITGDANNVKMTVKIVIGSTTFYMDVKLPNSVSATTTTVTVTLTAITFNADGTTTLTYTVAYTTAAGAAGTGGETAGTGTTNTSPKFFLDKVYATNSSGSDVALSSTEVTDIPFGAMTFKLAFSQTIAAVPSSFSVTVTETSTGNTITFTDSTSGLGTIATSSTDAKVLVLSVNGQTGSRVVNPYTSYSVVFNSATVKDTNGNTAVIGTSSTYKFKTSAAKLVSWIAQNSTGTTVGASTGGNIASTAAKLVLTFDANMYATQTLTDAQFTKTVNSGSSTTRTNASYTAYFSTSITVSGKTITVPFATGKTLIPGNYTVKYAAGTFKDYNGSAVDTTASATFTVN